MVDIIACTVVAILFYPAMSLAEWLIHSRLMHTRTWAHRWLPGLSHILTSHAKFHHGQCFRDHFDHDDQLACNLFNLTLDIPWVPLILAVMAIGLISWWAAGLFAGLVILHHWLWGLVHTEMHIPARPWLRRLSVFQAMSRHHALHHRYPNKNFCVVCIGADTWLGTRVK